jgi:hypothetical protein
MLQSYFQISYENTTSRNVEFPIKDKTFLYLVMSHQSGVTFVTGAMHLCVLIVIIQTYTITITVMIKNTQQGELWRYTAYVII